MEKTKQTLLGKKVLVIGTDSGFLNKLETTFFLAGADVVLYKAAEEGALAIKTQKPDLILIESPLPNITPSDFAKKIKENNIEVLPVIIITDDVDDKFSNLTSEPVVSKSKIELNNLIKIIENILAKSQNDRKRTMLDISELTTLSAETVQNNKIKVLIVEDDPLLRNLLSVRFTKSKLPYQFCHNGIDVMDMILQFKPTIVILDLMLPGKNGIDVLREIREYKELNNLPIIIFSNKDSDVDRKLARSLGSDTFLIKAMTDLNDLINIILEKHRIS